jgi:multidrug efflux system outer membrane protein
MVRIARAAVWAGVAALAALTGCTVGPDYVRPPADVPTQFAEGGPWKAGEPQDAIARGDWWTIFSDPVLDALQAKATRQNPDVKAVAARVLQAQATAGISRSYLYPSLAGGVIAQRFANNTNFATLVDPATVTENSPLITNGYKAVPIYTAYEIDFWGKIRRQSESAQADLGASIATYHTAMLTLNSDVAQTYFQIRTNDELYRILSADIELHRNTFNLINARQLDGLSNDLAVAETQTALKTSQAQAEAVKAQRATLVNKLAILTGTNPEGFVVESQQQRGERPIPPVPVGLPSDLLQRRPDIARAEREMAAANAQIGVAIAAYFPSIVLTSAVGFESYALSTLVNPTSNIWGVAFSLFQQIFNAGRISLNVERTRAAYEERVALYQASLLRGFQDVETALANLRLLNEQARYQQAAVASANRTALLMAQRFQHGLVSMLDVLIAQRAALASQTVAVQIANEQLVTTVALVKALGGGWQDRPQQLPEGVRSMWAPPLKQAEPK